MSRSSYAPARLQWPSAWDNTRQNTKLSCLKCHCTCEYSPKIDERNEHVLRIDVLHIVRNDIGMHQPLHGLDWYLPMKIVTSPMSVLPLLSRKLPLHLFKMRYTIIVDIRVKYYEMIIVSPSILLNNNFLHYLLVITKRFMKETCVE